jgi:hypothetical protein
MEEFKRDRRRSKRYNVDTIHGNLLYSADINIVDISLGGVAIETSKRLNISKEYSLKIKYKDSILNLRGIIVWSLLSRTKTQKTGEVIPVYKAGMKFAHSMDEKTRELMKFIEENKTETIEKRMLAVRFKIKKVDDAIIDHTYEYKIKQISLSGMLIETDNSFDVESRCVMELVLDNSTLSLVGRVVNCVEFTTENIALYHIGIEFVEISDEDKSYLKGFLDSLDNMEKRIRE